MRTVVFSSSEALGGLETVMSPISCGLVTETFLKSSSFATWMLALLSLSLSYYLLLLFSKLIYMKNSSLQLR